MGVLGDLWNGATDVVTGPAEFVVDVIGAGRSAVAGDFGDAAETVFNSVQEDLLGQTIGGLFGPEGIGGTLIGALPESVRDIGGSVLDPAMGAWDWTVQELVDRPLGTMFTVMNATRNDGIQHMFDVQTYARAWDINDKRTFGQSYAAAIWNIDPFDDDEYNAIQDDPLFNLISGAADFIQEFIDPVSIIGGTAFKAARGSAVMGHAARPTRGALFGAPRDITRVYGGRTGFRPRPTAILGGERSYLTKTSDQIKRRNDIIGTHQAQRGIGFIESKPYARIETAMAALDSVDDRFHAFTQMTGQAGKKMPREAIRLFANGETPRARARTMRALSGDMSVFAEITEDAEKLAAIMDSDGWTSVAQALQEPMLRQRAGAAKYGDEGDLAGTMFALRTQRHALHEAADQALEFTRIADDTDWAVMAQFKDSLFDSQTIDLEFKHGRYLGTYADDSRLGHLAIENDALLRAGLESIIGGTHDLLNTATGSVQRLPWGTRLPAILRQHGDVLDETGKPYVMSEFHNPHTVGGRIGGHRGRAVRILSERTPQTHVFFDDPGAAQQFERVLTQAQRINVGGVAILDATEAGRLMSSFTKRRMEQGQGGVADFYADTVKELNNRLDAVLHNSGLDGIDLTARSLSDAYNATAKQWAGEAGAAKSAGVVGVTDKAGRATTTRKLGNGEYVVVQHRVSPSQVRNSAVQPRYDVVQRQIELAQSRAGSIPRKMQVKVGDTVRGVIHKTSNVVDTPQQAWRSAMLLTPKWPMRVGLDEQLRAAANLGGLVALGNLVTAIPELRRAFALHKLDGIDEATDVEALTRVLREQTGADDSATLLELLNKAGDDGVKDATRVLAKEKVHKARDQKNRRHNTRRLGYNAALKGVGVGALLGNPVAGGIYGFVALTSKRRNINRALERKSALNYAGALREEGEKLLRAAVGPEELAEARKMIDDASHIQKLVDANVSGASTIQNTFDEAERLMQDAGVSGLSIGGLSFRNAFGDDPRYQEQIRSNVSASRSQSAVYSGARRDAERQLRRYEHTDWEVADSAEYSTRSIDGVDEFEEYISGVGDIDQPWQIMMNQFTSGDLDQRFYQIVWSNSDVEIRVRELADLLESDQFVYRDLVSKPLNQLGDGDLEAIARSIVDEYDNVLPSKWFGDLREKAALGQRVPWEKVKKRLDNSGASGIPGADPAERLTNLRKTHPGFGKTIAPEPVSHKSAANRQVAGKAAGWFEDLFKMFGTFPTDELARNPFFRVKYEREIRRRIAILQDSDGNVRLSQRNIDEIEQQARDGALGEVREVMYDLAENTRASEMIGNAMPFFNAWQEVIGRWAGFAAENPTFVGNALRLYRKPWDAEALGISEVTVENLDGSEGATYLMFRPFGPAYDSDGNETTIFDAMPTSLRNFLIPAAILDQDATVRFSKEGLNTIAQSPTPGFGPLITIPVREAILANPSLEETFGFMFPFGHPEGGFFDRAIKGNAPTWMKSVDDYFREDSQTTQRVVQRMFQDICVQRAEAGDPLDWNDEQEIMAAVELANDRARQWALFRIATGLFSPTSATLLSVHDPSIQEARRLQREHGTKIGNAMFLDEHGEDFFALTARMTKLNDGVAASVASEENYMKHQDIVEAHPEIGAWVTASLGGTDEAYVFSQAVYRRQQAMKLAPGSEETRRERKTPLEAMGDAQAQLGWVAYSEVGDFVRMRQEAAIAAGMSGSLNATHLRDVSAYKQAKVAELRQQYPTWAVQYDDFGSSNRRMKDVVDGFAAALKSEQLLQRPSTIHVIDYFELRVFVQHKLQERKLQGGSDDLTAKSNEDLQLWFVDKKEAMAQLPQFTQVYDRYFERDMIAPETFTTDDMFEGLF